VGEGGAVGAGVGRFTSTLISGRHSDVFLLRVRDATAGVGSEGGSEAPTTFLALAGIMGVARSTSSTWAGVQDLDLSFTGVVLGVLGVTDLDFVLIGTGSGLDTWEGVFFPSGVGWEFFGVVVRDLNILSTGVWVTFD